MDGKQINQEVEQFNKDKLRKTETYEKKHIPTQAEIDEEKKANQQEGNCPL